MCFSAEASFAAAAVLTTIGAATLRINFLRSYLFLAMIPLLFAVQQFAEGILWVGLEAATFPTTILILAKKIFLIFAFLIWPIWIPLALTAIETVLWKKKLMFLDLGCGILLSLSNLFYATTQSNISAQIVNHSIQYNGYAPSQAILYPAIILIPCFLSSLKHIRLYGVLIVLSYLLTSYYYSTTFVSVWCFFAALISLSIYKILKDNREIQALETTHPKD